MTDREAATIDSMRQALNRCTFLPASHPKKFVRSVATIPLDRLSQPQINHIRRLAWRFRRQMPAHLVPSHDAIEQRDLETKARIEAGGMGA